MSTQIMKGETPDAAWDPWCAKNAIIYCQELLAPATPNRINQSSPTSFFSSHFWVMECSAYLFYVVKKHSTTSQELMVLDTSIFLGISAHQIPVETKIKLKCFVRYKDLACTEPGNPSSFSKRSVSSAAVKALAVALT